jgi:uncharacterized protein
LDHDHTSTQVAPGHTRVAPTKQRYSSLDTLRGFALLGILVPNIWFFAWPVAAATNPPSVMSDNPVNILAQDITSVVFLGKFMFNFALLFGAGVVMYGRKYDTADENGNYHAPLTKGSELWFVRCSFLLVFGMIHAYLFWYGDILTAYAVSGLTLVWWVRRINPKLQLVGGLALFSLGALIMASFNIWTYFSYEAGDISSQQLSGNPAQEIEGYSGSFIDALQVRFITTFILQAMTTVFFLPSVWGMMIMGMGLTRLGYLTGEKSTRTYLTFAAILLPVGLGTTLLAYTWVNKTFALYPGFVWQSLSQAIGVPLALGYTSLLIALSKLNWAKLITVPLAAVGRMALTNYFSHTLLCTTFFYGYGLGYFAQIEYPQLWLVVLAVWAFNIIFSLLWLQAFKMGPFEWLWRCLTYRRLVPIR